MVVLRCCESGVLVRCMCRGQARGLLFVARVTLLACVGGLAFIMCVPLAVSCYRSCLRVHS